VAQVTVSIKGPPKIYTDNGDGTVTDPSTKLIWKRCAEGQTWTGSDCSGAAVSYSWDTALGLTGGGFAGKSWRLPSKDELNVLVEVGSNPAISATAFPNTPAVKFWTATSDTDPDNAWVVDFGTGTTTSTVKLGLFEPYKTRLVSEGKPAAGCTYSLDFSTISVDADATFGSVNVTSNCAGWTAKSNDSWITIGTVPQTVSGSLSYTVAANTSSTGRTGTLTIAGQTFTVNQLGRPPALSCTLSASPTAIAAGGASTLMASCTGATSHVWSDGTCSPTSFTCTVSPTADTKYTVVGKDGTAVADASVTVTVAPRPVVGAYDGIYQWFDPDPTNKDSRKTYLSLHQDGANMIATLYFNESLDPALPFLPTSGGPPLPVALLDAFDLFSGPVTGATAKLEGTRVFRFCKVSYDLTFGDNGQLTATRTNVSKTNEGDLARTDCEKALAAEGATLTMRRIPFGVASSVVVAGPVDGIYQWSTGNYLSLHQDGADLIATNYFNENYPIAGGPKLNLYDLLGGSFSGATAQISGKRYHRACEVGYSLTFNADGSLTATRTRVANTAAADTAGINCKAIVEAAEGTSATFTVPRLEFKVTP
jgi:hypothetical protein